MRVMPELHFSSWIAALLGFGALLGPRAADAHEFWLAPSRYAAGAGDTVAFGVLVGTGFRGELKPWAAPRAVRFTMLAQRARDLRPVTLNGDVVWARVVMPDPGGALVRGWTRPLTPAGYPVAAAARDSLGPALSTRTGADGVASLDLTRAGEWMLSCVHMVPSEDTKEADWQSLWASLTFARPERAR